ncbi:oligopeptide/dipeptide ABC transporter, ATPase subunit [Ignisphaera aggregans DSM 17230]|uniref:Oligopeptide/dipeptide ABC transporter, ATPase subunit n=1 Tax=Ignisphaera aggregans (strain DSM 17230 / JCM 13409 / AQ1.S1) TaxID=583356 RepID=E0SSU2_IGNAA|nr:oligopeptide/dipeptide ABC transporter, ATPase subunit [Ignisphaera aggregans DSM 17230]
MSRPILIVDNVKKYFEVGLFGSRKMVRAVDGVSFTLYPGETLGIVGESGSGKTTLGKLVLRLYRPTAGRIIFDGMDITYIHESKLRPLRSKMQLIPQDPYASFNPLQTIGEALAEPLIVHGLADRDEARQRVLQMLEKVGLIPPEDFYMRRSYHLSGGQLQRAAIARAMLLEPQLIVADEPTSNLDVSIRASILELIREFKEKYNQALIFITHDLAIARLVSNNIAVMYLGKIVEYGPSHRVLVKPLHPYTQALLTAIPKLRKESKIETEIILRGEIPDPSKPPSGCRLHPRCPLATEICSRQEPQLNQVEKGHWVACHRVS